MRFMQVKRTDPEIVLASFINGSASSLTRGEAVTVTSYTTPDGVSVSTPSAAEGGCCGIVYATAATLQPVLVQVYGYHAAAHCTNTAHSGTTWEER